jgi:uncharacterized protein YjbI with pentapeptide repeats
MPGRGRPPGPIEPAAPESPTGDAEELTRPRDQLVDVRVGAGDACGVELVGARWARVELRGVELTDARLRGAMLTDVSFVGCELSAADLHEATLRRVSFRECRMAALNLSEATLRHVTFAECKLDEANLRMATVEHAAIVGGSAVRADALEARLEAVRATDCDLTGLDVRRVRATGLDLRGSTVDGLVGAAELREVVIGVDQLIPFALAVFAGTGVRVVDR